MIVYSGTNLCKQDQVSKTTSNDNIEIAFIGARVVVVSCILLLFVFWVCSKKCESTQNVPNPPEKNLYRYISVPQDN